MSLYDRKEPKSERFFMCVKRGEAGELEAHLISVFGFEYITFNA
jgi:hypothetical protein